MRQNVDMSHFCLPRKETKWISEVKVSTRLERAVYVKNHFGSR